MARPKKTDKAPKTIASSQSLSAFVKSICDVMRRSNCASALQYVPELTWILFLRILDAQETRGQEAAEVVGAEFSSALRSPYRWQDWAAPYSEKPGHPKTPGGKPFGWKRQELFAAGDGRLFDFINKDLLPHLHGLDIDARIGLPNPAASRKQRIIGRIMTAVERVRVDSETNLRDILDKVHEIHIDRLDDTHFFTLSQVYEDLLLKMGEKNSDGGQFFTKGGKTGRIWYYDLSGVKVGKKTPLTLAHFGFAPDGTVLSDEALPAALVAAWREDEANAGKPFPSYARLLVQRGTRAGDSRYSWTVDFAARRAKAREEMQPLVDEAAAIKAEVVDLKEQLKRLKRLKHDGAADAERESPATRSGEREKAVRELEAKAAAIDAAVFDLKAVNPNAVSKDDDRTPQQIIQNIERQGRIVAEALARLDALLAAVAGKA